MSETLRLKNVNMLSKEQYVGVAEPSNEELWAVSGLGVGFPSNKHVTLTLGASGATYTAPANGYFTLFGNLNSAEIYNNSSSNLYWGVNGPTSTFKGVSCPVKKGDIVRIYYATYGDNVNFRFIYAEGEE